MSIGDGAERSSFETHFARLTLSSCPSLFGPSICQGNFPTYSSHLFTSTHTPMPQGLHNLFQTTSTNWTLFLQRLRNLCCVTLITAFLIKQYVTCSTRLNKTIDLHYGSVPAAYTSIALPPIGSADHNCVLLAPVYKPVFHRHERVVKTVKS